MPEPGDEACLKAHEILGACLSSPTPKPFRPRSSTSEMMIFLSRSLAISLLVGLASATTENANWLSCKVVESAISNASGVYYPGEHKRLYRRSGELTCV